MTQLHSLKGEGSWAHTCCRQMAASSKVLLGMELGLGPGDVVLDGDIANIAPLPKKGAESPHFSAHVYCGQTAGWMKVVLGMDVGLSPGDFVLYGDPVIPPEQRGGGHIVLDGFPALRERRTASPSFRPMSIVATVAHLSYC